MAEQQLFTGSDVTDAIEKACNQLNTTQDKLDIEVVKTGSGGIFGLIKRKAQIRVSLKEQVDILKDLSAPAPQDSATEKKPAGKKQSSQPTTPIPPDVFPRVEEKLSGILERMGFPSNIETFEKDGKVMAHISSDFEEDIVGPEGQALDGLQFLVRKIISREFPGRVMVSLDAGNFRENRKQDLEEQALRLAGQVKETGKTRMLPALNPSERRIVHMCLQKDNTIRSRSVGDGIFKKILIYLPGKGKRRPSRKRKNEAAAKQNS